MPVYDYECSCGNRADDVFVHSTTEKVKCKECNKTMNRLFPTRVAVSIIPEEGIFVRDASPKGEVFHSKDEMRRYQKEHNVQLGALL